MKFNGAIDRPALFAGPSQIAWLAAAGFMHIPIL